MAHAISWKATTFEAAPSESDKIGMSYAAIQNTRKAVGERIKSEHCMEDTEDSSGNQGRHAVGSARAFYYPVEGDLPAVPATAKDFAAADGYAKGRIGLTRGGTAGAFWYKLRVFVVDTETSGAWVEPSYAHLNEVAETLKGLKTFETRPQVTDVSTTWAAANNADLIPKVKIQEALDALVTTVRDALIPVGFIYTQYPGMAAPATLWPWATWDSTEAAGAYAGAFFRTEGGTATVFGGTEQAQALPVHKHGISYGTSDTFGLSQSETGSAPGGFTIDHGTSGDGQYKHRDLPVETVDAGSGSELLVRNLTIRIWKRTA